MHQQADVSKATSIWWFESGRGSSLRNLRSQLGVFIQWEINKCGIPISRIEASHNDHVSQPLPFIKHRVHESQSSFVPSQSGQWKRDWCLLSHFPYLEQQLKGLLQGTAFLSTALSQKFWSLKACILQKMSTHTHSQVQ